VPAIPGSGAFVVRIGRAGRKRPDSDIDLLVEFLPNAEVGLVEHAGLMLGLERRGPTCSPTPNSSGKWIS
jgi:predicted nucleotidyltransferase